jgi:hypothetical protein
MSSGMFYIIKKIQRISIIFASLIANKYLLSDNKYFLLSLNKRTESNFVLEDQKTIFFTAKTERFIECFFYFFFTFIEC